MKIAVFASGHGDRARNLHDFFKEGNRVSLDIIYTDNPESPLIRDMQAEGVRVKVLPALSDGTALAEEMRNRGVELIVLDDFNGELPQEVRDAYGEAVVSPLTPQSAPLDVITTVDRINAALRNNNAEPAPAKPGEQTEETKSDNPSLPDVDREWAEVLEVEIEEPEMKNTPRQERPGYPENPGNSGAPVNPAPPQFGFGAPGHHTEPQREPMPDTYLIWSVVITLLCCLIFGVIAIVYSASVSSKYYRGDIEGAKRASRNAQIWCIVSIVAGILWATLYVPLTLLVP